MLFGSEGTAFDASGAGPAVLQAARADAASSGAMWVRYFIDVLFHDGTSITKLLPANRIVVAELFRWSLHDDATRLEEKSLAREIECECRVLLYQKNPDAGFCIDRAQDAEDFAHDQRRKAERGLV